LQYRNGPDSTSAKVDQAAEAMLQKIDTVGAWWQDNNPGAVLEGISKALEIKGEKSISAVGARTLDAVTGVLGVAEALHKDRAACDNSYGGTVKATLVSVSQMLGGAAVAGTAATLIGVGIIPIAIGVGVSAGIGWGLNRWL
jgi:hypothetical protein